MRVIVDYTSGEEEVYTHIEKGFCFTKDDILIILSKHKDTYIPLQVIKKYEIGEDNDKELSEWMRKLEGKNEETNM